MFVIISSDGTVRREFIGCTVENIVELACELRCENDPDFSKRIAEARRLLTEDQCQ
jgi:hypothetical protein